LEAKFTVKNRPENCLAASQQAWRHAGVFGHVIGYVCIAPGHRKIRTWLFDCGFAALFNLWFELPIPILKKASLLPGIWRSVGVLNGASQAPDNVRKQRAVSATTRNDIFRSAVDLRSLS